MNGHGFIHGEMDMKILILYVLSKANEPMDFDVLLEFSLVDKSANYFDFCQCLQSLKDTKHVLEAEGQKYLLSPKGAKNLSLIKDSLAFAVRSKVEAAVESYNRRLQRESLISSGISVRDGGVHALKLSLGDGIDSLMELELVTGSKEQAEKFAKCFSDEAEGIYRDILQAFISRVNKPPGGEA